MEDQDLDLDRLAEMFRKRLVVLKASLERLEKLCAPSEAPATGLLRLPFEIRLQIYHHCIPRKRLVDVSNPYFSPERPSVDSTSTVEDGDSEYDAVYSQDCTELDDQRLGSIDYWDSYKNKNSIFLLSRQISGEALDVLYGENVFKLHLHGEGEYYLKKNFVEANRQRMRYLLLTAGPRGVSYTPGRIPDDSLWRSILPQLKLLRIVAEQPRKAGGYYNAPTLEQDMECWVNWIRPFLRCFGRHLLGQTVVEVDDDGQVETEALLKECLPGGYRKVQCHVAGDLIFRRGRFSLESGYWDDDDGPTGSWDAYGDWDSD